MKNTDSYKLSVKREEDILDNGSIIPRCYEVTYLKSSEYMSINIDRDEDKSINLYKGDGLCGRWCCEDGKYMLFFQINVDGKKKGYEKVKENNKSVRETIPLMLNAIRKSDENFYSKYKDLDEAEIFIKFNSLYDDFYRVENWDKLKKYIKAEIHDENKTKEKKLNNIIMNQLERIRTQNNLILNLLNPHIEIYLFSMYGKDIRFIINAVSLLNLEEVNLIDGAEKNHEVVVLVKILGRNELEEVLLNIIIRLNSVIVRHIV